MAESDGYFNVVMNLDEFNISNKTLFYFNLNPQIGMTVTDISSVLYSLSIILLEPAPIIPFILYTPIKSLRYLINFISIFSILGMNLFGCKFCDFTGDVKICDRKNFDSLLWATVTVFQVFGVLSR